MALRALRKTPICQAVLGEAHVCCVEQPVLLVGPNPDRKLIHSIAKSDGRWVDLENVFLLVEASALLQLQNEPR